MAAFEGADRHFRNAPAILFSAVCGFQAHLSHGWAPFVEARAVEVADKVGQRAFDLRTGNANGGDEQATPVFLIREEMLDAGPQGQLCRLVTRPAIPISLTHRLAHHHLMTVLAQQLDPRRRRTAHAAQDFSAQDSATSGTAARPDVFDNPANIDELNGLLDKFGVPPNQALTDPASLIPDDYFPMLAKIESGNRPYVKAKTSTASGLYQFIRSTWVAEGGQWGPDKTKAFGGLMPSEAEQTERARSFTAKNARALAKAGIRINKATLYAAHFLGSGTAILILRAPTSKPAEDVVGQAAAKANPSILKNKTVGDFRAWLEKKTEVTP